MVMRLPDEQEPEYILMTPFTPRQKDNLAAWMVARNDGERYGELVVYRFPRQSLVYGPRQIDNRINQDTEIAQQLSLWDQSGSQVIRGELLVIPLDESLIYVQPIYLRAEGGRIPELKRVVVAYQNQVSWDETLDGALAQLFGRAGAAPPPPPPPLEVDGVPQTSAQAPTAAAAAPPVQPTAAEGELLRRARQHYDRALAAQRAGDWAAYGAEIERLGEALRRLEAPARPE
jgi:uncharacterized membrane protein (UPF0182 family)